MVRIGESLNAPLLKVVVQPNDWQKQIRGVTGGGGVSEKGALYVQFWGKFLDRVRVEHPEWTKSRHRGPHNWFEMKAPIKGCRISHSFAQHDRLRHELYIDSGEADANTELFDGPCRDGDRLRSSTVLGRAPEQTSMSDRRVQGRLQRHRRRAIRRVHRLVHRRWLPTPLEPQPRFRSERLTDGLPPPAEGSPPGPPSGPKGTVAGLVGSPPLSPLIGERDVVEA